MPTLEEQGYYDAYYLVLPLWNKEPYGTTKTLLSNILTYLITKECELREQNEPNL